AQSSGGVRVALVVAGAAVAAAGVWRPAAAASAAPPGRTSLGFAHETLRRDAFDCLSLGFLWWVPRPNTATARGRCPRLCRRGGLLLKACGALCHLTCTGIVVH